MNVLSLFDGMSCGQIALNRAGINYDNYFSSEIDKYAIKVTQHNYSNTKQLGDVACINAKTLPEIDLLIGGSPCQGFSFAGKQLNFNDPRSKLFFEYVRLLKELSPKYFLLENVVMKKEYQDVISNRLGVEPILINSSLVSAQNRKRLYWTNIPNVTLPDDKGIVLADIVEDGDVDRNKSHCLDANYFKGGNLKSYFEKHRRQLVFNTSSNKRIKGISEDDRGFRPHQGDSRKSGISELGRILKPSASKTDAITITHSPKILCGAMRGRYLVDGKRQDHKILTAGLTEQRLELRNDGKTNTLTTVQKDNYVVDETLSYRKLTPLECERLQTVPDNYTGIVSNSQRYKMLGNGWTVDVIAHIFKGIA